MRDKMFFGLLALLLLSASFSWAAAGDLAGIWNVTLDTEGGIRKAVWEFSVSGEEAILKTSDQKVTGTFRQGQLDFKGSLYAAEAGYTADFVVKGKIEGDEITGQATWDMYQMTFTATRAD